MFGSGLKLQTRARSALAGPSSLHHVGEFEKAPGKMGCFPPYHFGGNFDDGQIMGQCLAGCRTRSEVITNLGWHRCFLVSSFFPDVLLWAALSTEFEVCCCLYPTVWGRSCWLLLGAQHHDFLTLTTSKCSLKARLQEKNNIQITAITEQLLQHLMHSNQHLQYSQPEPAHSPVLLHHFGFP